MSSPESDPFENLSEEDPSYEPQAKRLKGVNLKQTKLFAFYENVQPDPYASTSETNPGSATFTASIAHHEETQNEKILNTMNVKILGGKFYKIKTYNVLTGSVEAFCQVCLPVQKIIKGSQSVTTNFVKHLKRMHPTEYDLYQKDVHLKKSEIKAEKTTTCSPKIKQEIFDKKIIAFVTDTMSPLSIVENPCFVNLFSDMKVNLMGRKALTNGLKSIYLNHVKDIKAELSKQKYVCTTADIWSSKTRSFFGVTCHFITDDFKRKSYGLACQRFRGEHNFRSVAEILQSVHCKYNIDENNIVATVTDNGSNMIKAFNVYSVENKYKSQENEAEDDFDDDVIELRPLPEDVNYENELCLPKHKRCSSHSLNLVATTDVRKSIEANHNLRTRNMHAMNKCKELWKKCHLPKSSEMIKDYLGHTLSSPGITRWNSLYDSLQQIVSVREKLPQLFHKLGLKYFTEGEIKYIEEYTEVLKPLAIGLDMLQGEHGVYYGMLLPTLVILSDSFLKLERNQYKLGGEIILKAVQEGLKRRFSSILRLEDDEAVISTVSHPQFKLRWFSTLEEVDNNLAKSREDVKRILIDACEEFASDELIPELPRNIAVEENSFFKFKEDESNTNSLSLCGASERTEIQVLNYLKDNRQNLEMLNDFPLIKKAFFKYNTCLPSSASVERLFSIATLLNAPKRNALSDENFEMLVVLKSNKICVGNIS